MVHKAGEKLPSDFQNHFKNTRIVNFLESHQVQGKPLWSPLCFYTDRIPLGLRILGPWSKTLKGEQSGIGAGSQKFSQAGDKLRLAQE